MRIELTMTSQDNGKRAVDVLAARTGMSRLLAKRIRLYGRLLVDGQPARMIDPVCAGQKMLAVYGNEQNGCRLKKVAGVTILYQDDWIVVASKPSGMVTHPSYLHATDGMTTLLSDDPLLPVNRLDRDTTGLVLFATNGHAHHVLSQSQIDKEYVGIVHGVFEPLNGCMDAPIGRAPDSIIERTVDIHNGQPSRTRYETREIFDRSDISLVRFVLETGRTHQIRVHCLHAGHALVGDTLYASTSESARKQDVSISRQALHASYTAFPHPWTGQWMSFYAGLPPDMERLITSLRTDGAHV